MGDDYARATRGRYDSKQECSWQFDNSVEIEIARVGEAKAIRVLETSSKSICKTLPWGVDAVSSRVRAYTGEFRDDIRIWNPYRVCITFYKTDNESESCEREVNWVLRTTLVFDQHRELVRTRAVLNMGGVIENGLCRKNVVDNSGYVVRNGYVVGYEYELNWAGPMGETNWTAVGCIWRSAGTLTISEKTFITWCVGKRVCIDLAAFDDAEPASKIVHYENFFCPGNDTKWTFWRQLLSLDCLTGLSG